MKKDIALGTLQFSGWYGKLQDKDCITLIRSFIETGGMYIDTAPLYGFGKTDKLIRSALQLYSRRNYKLITKCGFINLESCNSIEAAKKYHKNTSYKSILQDFDKSIENLRTDYIDIYLLHTRDGITPLEESLSALQYLQKRKKVTYIGICNTTLEELMYIQKFCKINYIQNRFSLINRSISNVFSTYLSENNISLLPYRVIDYGLLSDKAMLYKHILFNNHDSRNTKPDLQKDKQELIITWANEYLTPIASLLGITIAQLCIAWTFTQPFVQFPIIGISNKNYLSENIKATKISLTDTTVQQINHAYSMLKKKIWDRFRQPVYTFRGLNERYY